MKSAIFLSLYLASMLILHGEVNGDDSLEWLTDTSESIGIYQVAAVNRKLDSSSQLSFQLAESLKGKPPQTVDSTYSVRLRKGAPPLSISNGNRFLVFLKVDDDDSVRADYLINISISRSKGVDSTVIISNFEVLTDPTQMLATVRERIKSHPNATPRKLHQDPGNAAVNVPPFSPAYWALYMGSSCYLLVPEDLKTTKINDWNPIETRKKAVSDGVYLMDKM